MKTKEEKLKTRREWYKKNGSTERSRLRKSNKESRKKTFQWWRDYKSTLSCTKCPEDHSATLDFHHRDPSKKEFNISKAVSDGWSKERIIKETQKCDVLCANCHRKHHYNKSL